MDRAALSLPHSIEFLSTESKFNAIAIVPARIGSTRLGRKMLLRDTGQYLFEHTLRNALRAPSIAAGVIATDSKEIFEAANSVGLEAVMTSPDHQSGTDRVREAHQHLLASGRGPWDVILNVQGDEPELEPQLLDRLVACFAAPQVRLATLSAPLACDAAEDPSRVKVVRDAAGDALYFSRSKLPNQSRAIARGEAEDSGAHWLHIGVYAFRPGALEQFCQLPPGRLEGIEQLEQLRWLEAGHKIRVLEADAAPAGIDTREDYEQFCRRSASAP